MKTKAKRNPVPLWTPLHLFDLPVPVDPFLISILSSFKQRSLANFQHFHKCIRNSVHNIFDSREKFKQLTANDCMDLPLCVCVATCSCTLHTLHPAHTLCGGTLPSNKIFCKSEHYGTRMLSEASPNEGMGQGRGHEYSDILILVEGLTR